MGKEVRGDRMTKISYLVIRVTSWIVPFLQKSKDDPRSHTNQHEPKYSRLELDVTFEAKPKRNASNRFFFEPERARRPGGHEGEFKDFLIASLHRNSSTQRSRGKRATSELSLREI
jgi:hypothetical protein